MNFVNFLRTPFLKEHLRWLLLQFAFSCKFYLQADIREFSAELAILMVYDTTILTRGLVSTTL